MLLREEDDGAVVAIGQASHAWVSGQLARAWDLERFGAGAERVEELYLGAEQHDVGMAAWDLAPRLDPATGLPVDFMHMTLDEHLALWTAAPTKLLTQSRYAALLVSLHGTTLYERRDLSRMPVDEADRVRTYLAAQHELQQRLVAELGADEALVDRHRRLIFCWDALSLALCLRWRAQDLPAVASGDAPDGPAEVAIAYAPTERGATLDPWPFAADRIEVQCEGRRLNGRSASEPDLHAALAAADHVRLRFVVESLPSRAAAR